MTVPKRPQRSRFRLIVVPPDPGRKSAHLVVLKHRGGGWYDASCMGQARRCKAGECPHVRMIYGTRRVRPVPRPTPEEGTA